MITCGAPTPKGLCGRKLRPGARCPEHRWVVAPENGREPVAKPATTCSCQRPVAWYDADPDPDMKPHCIRCGKALPEKKSTGRRGQLGLGG